jgi:CheY-like chemotaxis protein
MRVDKPAGRAGKRAIRTISSAAASAGDAKHPGRPSWRPRRQAAALTAPRASGTRRGNKNKTVLVVADAPALRSALARVLRQDGCHVLSAPDGWKAQRLAEHENRIDLLFLHLSAPRTSDLQLAQWFLAIHSETKALVAADSLWELSLQFGASHRVTLLPKPFTPVELVHLVHRILR